MKIGIVLVVALALAATPTALADDLWPDDLPIGPPDPGQGCRPACDLSLPEDLLDGPPDPGSGCKPNC